MRRPSHLCHNPTCLRISRSTATIDKTNARTRPNVRSIFTSESTRPHFALSDEMFLLALFLLAADTGAPEYTAGSIVNPIAAVAGMYAPNSFMTIYGRNLSYVTRAMGPDDLRAGMLPGVLIGT